MDEMEKQVGALALPALRPDHIAQQQDKTEVFYVDIYILFLNNCAILGNNFVIVNWFNNKIKMLYNFR